MKTKQEIAIELYNKTFYDTTVQIGERQYFTSDDREIKLPCIETERFVAKAIYSLATNYAGYSKELQQLYTNTFANSDVVGKYASGNVYSVDDYVARINMQSARWLQGYPFAAFMVIDKEQSENQESDIVAGYQVIGNSNSVSTGELAYLFAPKYHRGKIYQNVGYECVGALVLYYGQRLHDNGTDITIKIAGLEKPVVAPFKMVSATVRTDNPGSYKILDKLGFNKNPNIVQKYNDCERHEYFKPYGNESYVDVLQLTSTALLGETTSDLDIVD